MKKSQKLWYNIYRNSAFLNAMIGGLNGYIQKIKFARETKNGN